MAGKTLDLGRRIELHALDEHCAAISVALYRREQEAGPEYLVHSYSQKDGTVARLAFIGRGLEVLAGLQPVAERPGWLTFPCGGTHERALRRAFLDVCRLSNDEALEHLPLQRFDKKADCEMAVRTRNDGDYQIAAVEETEMAARRVKAIARGFAKLFELSAVEEDESAVRFTCGGNHEALLGLLFFRAQNVRSAMKEDEMAASRGTLAAPGSQSSES